MDEEKILKEYERNLEIPDSKPEKQFIICPVGVVGSGKTTVIKPLSKELYLLRISTDEIRELLRENGYGYDAARELAYMAIDKYLGKGFSIAIDGDCSSKEAKGKIKNFQEKYKVKIFWVHINPPEDFIIHKLKNYKHTWLFKDAEQAISNFKKSKAKHQNLDFPFIYTFDTSRDNLEKQIKEAVSIIHKN